MVERPSSIREASQTDAAEAGFTLAEVVIALAIVAMTMGGIVYGYLMSAKRAEWAAYSLAAQSLAAQGVEQMRAAQWAPEAWPVIDQMPPTNFATVEPLDVPVSGIAVLATNYHAITQVSASPPLRQLRVDCVWMFGTRGPYTNSVATFRAPDQ